MKKSSAEQKKFRPKIFSYVKYFRLFGKNENRRNENSESLFVTKTIVVAYANFTNDKRSRFSEGHSMWSQNG